ncbi:MAG: DUF2239 family protein [Acidobacteria bacterium]|nr:DUF2239 family protein [Acidobacteriota bacterium]
MEETGTFTAFHGQKQIVQGALETVLPGLRAWTEKHGESELLCFEDRTGRQVDFDLQGVTAERAGPGRPKLGVVSREVSLLPRHWEWLQDQPSGASAALRRLVDQARNVPENRERLARAAAGRFLTAMAGNLPGYEEASRVLYAGDRKKFRTLVAEWPADIRNCAERLAWGN